MNLRSFGLAIIVAFSLVIRTDGAIILNETFTYPDGGLVGQGGWAVTGTNASPVVSVTSGTVGLLTGQDVFNDFSGSITPSGVGYYGMDVTINSASTGGDYFAHFTDQGTSSTTAFGGRLFLRSSAGAFQFGISIGNAGTVYGASTVPAGTYRVVVRYDLISGTTNDIATVYVAPTSATEGSNTAFATVTGGAGTGTDLSSIGMIGLRQGGSTSAPSVTVDNLIVSDDFASAAAIAAPVPEPSTIALGSLAGLGFLGYRLRRKQG